jgi:hypothetical protein
MTLQDRFAPERLIAAACEEVGSDDFGTDFDQEETWREGLGLLCEGFVAEARLNGLGVGEALVLDLTPPEGRYWSVTLENIWHECIEHRRRRSSLTNAHAVRNDDGTVRIVIAATDPGRPNWLDTGHRHRGFVLLRWLDNPTAPEVTARVEPLG